MTDMLSHNVSKELPLYAVKSPSTA